MISPPSLNSLCGMASTKMCNFTRLWIWYNRWSVSWTSSRISCCSWRSGGLWLRWIFRFRSSSVVIIRRGSLIEFGSENWMIILLKIFREHTFSTSIHVQHASELCSPSLPSPSIYQVLRVIYCHSIYANFEKLLVFPQHYSDVFDSTFVVIESSPHFVWQEQLWLGEVPTAFVLYQDRQHRLQRRELHVIWGGVRVGAPGRVHGVIFKMVQF